jgi:hypothetical protein
MNDAEKKAECLRICGEAGQKGMHSIAPELCPIKRDEWLNPKRKIAA